MIVSLDPEEQIIVQGIASDRAAKKKDYRDKVSYFSPYEVSLISVASEYLVGRALGMLFDPSHYAGGDGHKRDLWRGPVTASLKTRGFTQPSHFIFPPNQDPGEFPDDYGIVGRWVGPRSNPYSTLELVGYFSYFDWLDHHEWIEMPWVKPGTTNKRRAYCQEHLRDINELVYDLERVKDETVLAVQKYGFKRCVGDWYRSGGDSVLRWDLCPAMED